MYGQRDDKLNEIKVNIRQRQPCLFSKFFKEEDVM